VWDWSKPVIAMIDGFCHVDALEFVMCCDIRCCSDTAKFAAIEARFSNGIATTIMPWRIGQRRRALLYTDDNFDSSEALHFGLVDKVFPKGMLQAKITKLAKRMSMVSLDCLKWNTRAIDQAFETTVLRNAVTNGAQASAIMDAVGSPEADQFDAIRRSNGLPAALKWRTDRLAPYE
jgi:enoyl-CoA hydratase